MLGTDLSGVGVGFDVGVGVGAGGVIPATKALAVWDGIP